MKDNRPLLSLCVPTYNRADRLKYFLQALCNAMSNKIEDNIEIIISDNASEDNTGDIVREYQEKGLKSTYYRNDKNVGFNKNALLLFEKYSHGEYIWIIGDDDFIDKCSLSYIVDLIEHGKSVEFIVLRYRLFNSIDTYLSFREITTKDYPALSSTFTIGRLSQALDSICDAGNILGTFMSSMIYKKERIDQKYLSAINIDPEYRSEKIQDQFPNAYWVLLSYIHQEYVYCVNDPLISIVQFEKEWDDKLQYLYYKVLPDLYTLLVKNGLEKKYLKNTRRCLMLQNAYLINRKNVDKYLVIRNVIRYVSLYDIMYGIRKVFKKINFAHNRDNGIQ
jgi:glycosyltransferase involved in cell wall biosynthesis